MKKLSNHLSNWVELQSQEFQEITFDPTQRVRWRIQNDIYEYSPEEWFTKNGSVCYNYGEWFNKYKKHRERNGLNIYVGGYDKDLQSDILSVVELAKAEQKDRIATRSSAMIDDLLPSLD